ncbi:MAG: glycosyltransferase family 4 protein [Novosphingobium sp.]
MTLICIDCRYIGPRPSGIGKVQQALVDHLPDMAPDLEFLFLKRTDAPEVLSAASNVREIVVKAAANSPATMWWLPRIAPLSGVDLFHATFNIMPAGLRMPCVTTVHDIMWLANPQWCTGRLPHVLERHFYGHGIGRALAKSAAITTVSDASKHELLAWDSSLQGRVFTTPPGIDESFRHDPKLGQPTVQGWPTGKRIVLTVGQNAPYKNHEGALRAFALAFGGRDDVALVFIQRLNQASETLRDMAQNLGIASQVHFLGPVDDAALVTCYNAAAVLLHPSLCEGYGLPLAEAMACGCPVVASDRSAMPEVLGGAGLLAPAEDAAAMAAALRQVVDDEQVSSAMRQAGLGRAAQLSWRRFADATLDVYRSVLQC